jgi:NADH-quinone oxidoreductase subunit F
MVRKVLHRIETGFGREEDIDLLWSIQSKMKETHLSGAASASSSGNTSL